MINDKFDFDNDNDKKLFWFLFLSASVIEKNLTKKHQWKKNLSLLCKELPILIFFILWVSLKSSFIYQNEPKQKRW